MDVLSKKPLPVTVMLPPVDARKRVGVSETSVAVALERKVNGAELVDTTRTVGSSRVTKPALTLAAPAAKAGVTQRSWLEDSDVALATVVSLKTQRTRCETCTSKR